MFALTELVVPYDIELFASDQAVVDDTDILAVEDTVSVLLHEDIYFAYVPAELRHVILGTFLQMFFEVGVHFLHLPTTVVVLKRRVVEAGEVDSGHFIMFCWLHNNYNIIEKFFQIPESSERGACPMAKTIVVLWGHCLSSSPAYSTAVLCSLLSP